MREEPKAARLRGTLDLLILKSLALQPLHGVGLFRRIDQITGGAIQVSYGSLFPALHRMERYGWLRAEWQPSEHGRRAKYYELTKAGHTQLRREEREWEGVVKAIATALRST